MRNMRADTIAKIFVKEIISRHSAPRELLSDQGKNFLSNLVKEVCDLLKTKKLQTTAYNPKCNGLTEKANRTLCQMLAPYINSNQNNWDQYIPIVLLAYRTCEQSSTGHSPFELLYGREPRLGDLDNFNIGYEPSDFIRNIHWRWQVARENCLKQYEKEKERYDNKYDKSLPDYKENELVRVKKFQTETENVEI
jgi:hypothetical protein